MALFGGSGLIGGWLGNNIGPLDPLGSALGIWNSGSPKEEKDKEEGGPSPSDTPAPSDPRMYRGTPDTSAPGQTAYGNALRAWEPGDTMMSSNVRDFGGTPYQADIGPRPSGPSGGSGVLGGVRRIAWDQKNAAGQDTPFENKWNRL